VREDVAMSDIPPEPAPLHDVGDFRDDAGATGGIDAESSPAPYTWRGLVSVAEYRHIMHDTLSTDAQIEARLTYLEALCRNVIRPELAKAFRLKV
jgi:hypothetical protein